MLALVNYWVHFVTCKWTKLTCLDDVGLNIKRLTCCIGTLIHIETSIYIEIRVHIESQILFFSMFTGKWI